MDADRFDHFVRSLTAPSRRSVLSVALGGIASALLGLADAQARKKKGKHKKKKKKCKGGTKKCGTKCIPSANCCTSADCPSGGTCQNGHCSVCEPQCDGKECGDDGCDSTCGTCVGNATCQGGQCVDPLRETCGIGYEECATSSDGCCVAGQDCCPEGVGINGCCGFDESCCPPNPGSPTYPDGECCDIGCPPSGSYCCGPDGGGGWCQIGTICCVNGACCPPETPVCNPNGFGCLAS